MKIYNRKRTEMNTHAHTLVLKVKKKHDRDSNSY